jgi:hypothetical protein
MNNYLRNQYIKTIADKLTICVEDLLDTELSIINYSFDIFNDRLAEIKSLSDENKRLSIELRNLKAANDNKDY